MVVGQPGSNWIQDKEIREAAKQAEEAFRANNGLPILDKAGIGEQSEKIQEFKSLQKSVPTGQKLKHFTFTDNVTLTQQILNIYPDATNILIINNDKRDALGVPTLTTRQLRDRFQDVIYSQGKRVLRSVS
jgi:hypothetical protein